MSISELIAAWRNRRTEWSRLHVHVDGVSLADEVIRDLEALDADEPLLTCPAAASKCGYTTDHLLRLIREGTLANYGKKGAPRVKLSECPRKTKLASGTRHAYDVDADARSLVSTRR